MKSPFLQLTIAMLFLLGTNAAVAAGPSAAELFEQVETRFNRLNTLSYQVKRTASSQKQRSEDQWQFRYSKPDMTRIDYHVPEERILFFDGTTLVEYLPTAKKALRTNISTLSGEQRNATLQGAFERIAIPGLRLGAYEEMSQRASNVKAVRWEGVDAFLVEGANPRYSVYIDPKRHVLLRTELYDKSGKLVLRADAFDFVEVSRDFWFPKEIKSTFGTPTGFLSTSVKFSEIKADVPITADIFRFHAPTGVIVINP